jgi:hypothetical protein
MAVSVLAFLLSLSIASDWIKRRDVDYVEGCFIEMKNRFVQWGTCWPCNSRFEADYNRPSATFRYFMLRLPGWYWERKFSHKLDNDAFSWHRHWLRKFGPEWKVISLSEPNDGR